MLAKKSLLAWVALWAAANSSCWHKRRTRSAATTRWQRRTIQIRYAASPHSRPSSTAVTPGCGQRHSAALAATHASKQTVVRAQVAPVCSRALAVFDQPGSRASLAAPPKRVRPRLLNQSSMFLAAPSCSV